MRGRFSSRSRYFRRGTGTRFVGKRYSNRANGREVPYYLGSGVEAHVNDVVLNYPLPPQPTTTTIVQAEPLNLIPRGTGIYDRESQRASMKYLLLRLRLSLESWVFNAANCFLSNNPVTMRVMLVYATRQLAATPSVNDFLVSPGGASLIATTGVQRIDSRENYQILYDHKMVLRNTNSTMTTAGTAAVPVMPGGDFTFKDLDVRIPINRPVSYTASSIGNINVSDVTSGGLFFYTLIDGMWFSAQNAIATSITGSSRLIFSP